MSAKDVEEGKRHDAAMLARLEKRAREWRKIGMVVVPVSPAEKESDFGRGLRTDGGGWLDEMGVPRGVREVDPENGAPPDDLRDEEGDDTTSCRG